MCFAKIVEHEGGRHLPSALVAATKHASKCLAMGPPFIAYNTFTERVDFMLIERSETDIFERAWATVRSGKTAASPSSAKPAEVAPAPSNPKPATAGKPPSVGKSPRGQKDNDEGSGNPTNESDAKKVKANLNKALQQMTKVKDKRASSASSLRTFMERTKTHPDYKWADKGANLSNIKEISQRMDILMTTGFNNQFLTEDAKYLRLCYKEDVLLQCATKYNNEVSDLAACMEAEVKKITAMHRLKTA